VRGATIILRSQWGAAALEGPVAVELVFVHSRPQRLCRKKDAHGRLWRDRRPDIDNLCKSALDAIQAAGIVADDGQVAVLEGRDMYGAKGESGKVEISVWRLGEMG
jgi:Holliday junction resolvase RusA-like endonuclease